MGTAWHCAGYYPWEEGIYVRGIETIKVNIMLRIYSNKWHVYAGLAILNPSAKIQIHQFAQSATALFKLMITSDEEGLRKRVYRARDLVFHQDCTEGKRQTKILLSEKMLDRFTLPRLDGTTKTNNTQQSSHSNSHLALLAMVDCWAELGIRPFQHLELLATPIFRLLIGVAEYLFRSQTRLDAAIHAAAHDPTFRSDDVEYVLAARGWSQCVSFGNFELYETRFKETAAFFEHRFADANKLGAQMIKAILESGEVAVSGPEE
ncbi:prephenate dehydrogenase (NADP(+)) [Tulasnella sp. 403]|nr:prephenate dehydrogenase (NADP(+)) [Tulasnella sp. 403]